MNLNAKWYTILIFLFLSYTAGLDMDMDPSITAEPVIKMPPIPGTKYQYSTQTNPDRQL